MIVSPFIISHFYVTIKTPLSYPIKEHDSSREDALNEVLLRFMGEEYQRSTSTNS